RSSSWGTRPLPTRNRVNSDNHGKRDEHLVPLEGSVDWSTALMTTQKIGYDVTWTFAVGRSQNLEIALDTVCRVRTRID
ncbi:uncharacterized protein METZ01_LOCUS405994, partial [marine metagenome]